MSYYLKMYAVVFLVSAAVFGFLGFIVHAAAPSEKCTCEMVKNHECVKD